MAIDLEKDYQLTLTGMDLDRIIMALEVRKMWLLEQERKSKHDTGADPKYHAHWIRESARTQKLLQRIEAIGND